MCQGMIMNVIICDCYYCVDDEDALTEPHPNINNCLAESAHLICYF